MLNIYQEVLTPDDRSALASLRNRGFSVAVFTPYDLRGADPEHVEEHILQDAWDTIETLATIPLDD